MKKNDRSAQDLNRKQVLKFLDEFEESQIKLMRMLDTMDALYWMKSVPELEYFIISKKTALMLWHSTPEFCKGKTDIELANAMRVNKPNEFGEICQMTDKITIEENRTCEFIETAKVDTVTIGLRVRKSLVWNADRDKILAIVGVAFDIANLNDLNALLESRKKDNKIKELDEGYFELL